MNQSMTMNESQVNFGKNIDNGKQSGIIEERSDREVNYKQNPSIGRMEGSYPSGGSSGSSGGGSASKTVSIKNVTGKNATIDKRKFTEYSLNPEKQPNKAYAFKEALGYDLSNYQQLENKIREQFNKDKMVLTSESEHGKNIVK